MENTTKSNKKRCTLLEKDVTKEYCLEKCRIKNCNEAFRAYVSQQSNEMETKE